MPDTDGSEIGVTDEMVEAGVDALLQHNYGCDLRDMVRSVFYAMAYAGGRLGSRRTLTIEDAVRVDTVVMISDLKAGRVPTETVDEIAAAVADARHQAMHIEPSGLIF